LTSINGVRQNRGMAKNPLSALVAVAGLVVVSSLASAAPHGIYWAKGAQPAILKAQKASAGGGLLYYGGPVISHPKVYAVFWGDKVDAETQAKIGPFFTNMLDSTYMDMLRQYATSIKAVDGRQGTNQTLNRGTYEGGIKITPFNASTALSDADVQAELDAQIAAGKLPKPSDDSLYMIYFPSGVSISIEGARSCSSFCAYHEGFKSAKAGANVYYGVMPVCGWGCGVADTAFDSLSVVSSHECMEAVTDPFPTPGDKPAYPQAWNDAGGQEIGDLCASGNSTVTGHGLTSAVQWEYDNSISGCNQGPWTQNAAPAIANIVVPPTPALPLLESLRSVSAARVFAGL
jgi:hypothetical protein